MVLTNGAPAGVVHFQRQRYAGFKVALFHRAAMDEQIAGMLLRVDDAKPHAVAGHDPGIADLTARLAVERRLIEHDGARLALFQRRDFSTVAHQCGNDAFRALGLVAEEFGTAEFFAQAKPDRFVGRFARTGPRRARLLALLFHGVGEAGHIDADA